MKTDNIRIKRKSSDFLLLGFIYLLMILFGIFLIGLPFLSFAPSGALARTFLVLLGIACLIAGGVLYGLLLYRGIRPQDALIITNKGFTNKLVGGKEGVYIAWTDVASMRIFGMSKAPILGLTLENNDAYLSALDGKNQREARANVEDGLPVLNIAQKEVSVPIQELKNLFSRMIKGAISWENYTTQRKKAEGETEKVENVTVESILQQAAEMEKAKQAQDAQPPKADKAAETAENLQSADLFRRPESKPSREEPSQKVEQPSAEKSIFRKVEMKTEQKQSEPEPDAGTDAEIAVQSEEPKAEEVKEPEAKAENEPVLRREQPKDYPETKVFPAYSAEKKTNDKEDIVFFDMEDE